jgi:hypothetical protein
MNVCEIYECIGSIIGMPLQQIATIACAGCFTLAGLIFVVVRRWE